MTPSVIAVLGGTGRVGREVVAQAVKAGHVVNVVSRSRERAMALPQPITVVDGDAPWPAVVDSAVAPADVVISTLGHTKQSPDDLMTQAVTHAIAAMERHRVQRIVVLSCASVRSDHDAASTVQRLSGMFRNASLGAAAKDHAQQARILIDSDLEWTLVRAPRIVDRTPSGNIARSLEPANGGGDIGREDLAAFLLACAVNGLHIRETPSVRQAAEPR